MSCYVLVLEYLIICFVCLFLFSFEGSAFDLFSAVIKQCAGMLHCPFVIPFFWYWFNDIHISVIKCLLPKGIKVKKIYIYPSLQLNLLVNKVATECRSWFFKKERENKREWKEKLMSGVSHDVKLLQSGSQLHLDATRPCCLHQLRYT